MQLGAVAAASSFLVLIREENVGVFALLLSPPQLPPSLPLSLPPSQMHFPNTKTDYCLLTPLLADRPTDRPTNGSDARSASARPPCRRRRRGRRRRRRRWACMLAAKPMQKNSAASQPASQPCMVLPPPGRVSPPAPPPSPPCSQRRTWGFFPTFPSSYEREYFAVSCAVSKNPPARKCCYYQKRLASCIHTYLRRCICKTRPHTLRTRLEQFRKSIQLQSPVDRRCTLHCFRLHFFPHPAQKTKERASHLSLYLSLLRCLPTVEGRKEGRARRS